MDRVIPRGSALPKPGNAVKVLVGEPIPVQDLMDTAREEGWSDDLLYITIADRIGASLHALKARLEDKPLSEVRTSPPCLPCS